MSSVAMERVGARRGALALLFGIACLPSVSAAATVVPLEIGELSVRSEVVFIGRVVAQESALRRSPRQVVTRIRFAVDEPLKGAPGDTLVLEQLGGTAGEGEARITQEIPGYARFEVGERMVLFLERLKDDRLVVTGLAQGKFTLRSSEERPNEVVAERTLEAVHFVARPTARAFAGVPPRGVERVPLATLRAWVAGEVRPPPFVGRLAPPAELAPVAPIPAGAVGGAAEDAREVPAESHGEVGP